MKRSILAASTLLMLLFGTTAMPAEARYGWGYGGWGYGGYRHHNNWSRSLGWGLGGLALGLGLGSLGSRGYYSPSYYGGYYRPYGVSVTPTYYGYGGSYWY
jgi:hypothetical protein